MFTRRQQTSGGLKARFRQKLEKLAALSIVLSTVPQFFLAARIEKEGLTLAILRASQ